MPDLTAHMWVAVMIVPVEVEENGEDLHTYTREGGEEVAREEASIGCFNCGTALTVDSYRSECAGANNLATHQ